MARSKKALAREAAALLAGDARYWIMHPDGTAQVAGDLISWARWMSSGDRQVAVDVVDGLRVSTVFLGLDHNMDGHGPPVLWETMIFKCGEALDWQQRHTSKLQAVRRHKAVVVRLKKGWRP